MRHMHLSLSSNTLRDDTPVEVSGGWGGCMCVCVCPKALLGRVGLKSQPGSWKLLSALFPPLT